MTKGYCMQLVLSVPVSKQIIFSPSHKCSKIKVKIEPATGYFPANNGGLVECLVSLICVTRIA